MSDGNQLDMERFLQLSALTGQSSFDTENAYSEYDDDDDDDERFSEYDDDDDDDEIFADSDDDYDDDEMSFSDYDDDDDDDEFFDSSDMSERKNRRRRRSTRKSWRRPRYRSIGRRTKLKRVRGSRNTTLRSPSGAKMRVRLGKGFATSLEVNKLIKDTERKFSNAMKERKTNYARLSKQIAKATSNLDGKYSNVRKQVKKLEEQNQTSSLMGLLQGQPKVKTIKITDDKGIVAGEDLKATVEFEKPNMLLPLLLSGGGLGGGAGGGDNSLLLALAFSNQNN
jgi:hypothetical protein